MKKSRMRETSTIVLALLYPLTAIAADPPVVISEFRTHGPNGGNDEFIELYNAGDTDVSIAGWKINGSNSSGSTSTRAVVPPGTVIRAKSFYLIANNASSGYSGTTPPDLTYSVGITDNGGIALLKSDNTIVDQVGMSNTSAYYEGTPLTPETTGTKSYERISAICGPDKDTNDNSSDFVLTATPNPQNSNSCRPSCAGDVCISPPGQCYEVPGVCNAGMCSYIPKNVGDDCDDGDPCTVGDKCDSNGLCMGAFLDCNAPPAPTCKDDNTRVVFSNGACVGGVCLYGETLFSCEFGCDWATGQCQNDPCAGVICETPPNTECYFVNGICDQGTCVYIAKPETALCSDGDLCTVSDHCDGNGNCLTGIPVVCPNLADKCIGDDLISYSNPRCDSKDGLCYYDETSIHCEFGCDAAKSECNNDPCEGVVCNAPPNNDCYEPDGQCIGGGCVYVAVEEGTACDDGNPCTTNDACNVSHVCTGVPLVCELTPPICESETVSKMTESSWCDVATGECHYQYRQVDCTKGCDEATGLCKGGVLISQFRTRGPNGGYDEFIELYNSSNEPLDIGGYKINGSNAIGSVSTRVTIPDGTVIGPQSYYLVANTTAVGPSYSGTVEPDLKYTTGITDDGGIALIDTTGTTVDQVGMSTGSVYKEGTPLNKVTSSTNWSYMRQTLLCGPDRDFNDNATDFVFGTASPRNSHSCRPECAGERCISNPSPFCLNQDQSQTYPEGVCDDQEQCSYPAVVVDCEWGCNTTSGNCNPDPCLGVTCETPPNDCYDTQGTCIEGECVYETLELGIACDDGNACTVDDQCDGSGHCIGTERTCDTPPEGPCWQEEGICVDGECVYAGKPETEPCDDGDLCTLEDHCDGQGACVGTKNPCIPPPPECLDEETSLVYLEGTCVEGECTYSTTEITCSFGCDEKTGVCRPDPCLNVICIVPPGPCYETVGTCVNGQCIYAPLSQGTECDDGDWCTEPDVCNAEHVCIGPPKECPDLPPGCLNDIISRSFEKGFCDPEKTGLCVYPSHDTNCEFGCNHETGLCFGDPCASVVCDQPPTTCHYDTGKCVEGECVYELKPESSACDDGDECTVLDACDSEGNCIGEPRVCETPPPPECVEGKSRVYSQKGTCDGGCVYPFDETLCDNGCDEASGLCIGDPCIGVVCTNPPGPCYMTNGVCKGGECIYAPKDAGVSCDDNDPCTEDTKCDGKGVCAGGSIVPNCQAESESDAVISESDAIEDVADVTEATPEATIDEVVSEETTPETSGSGGGGCNSTATGATWMVLAVLALALRPLRKR